MNTGYARTGRKIERFYLQLFVFCLFLRKLLFVTVYSVFSMLNYIPCTMVPLHGVQQHVV